MLNARKMFVAALLALSLTVVSAEAAPITGGFSIGGPFLAVDSATGALTTLAAATGIDFGTHLSAGIPGSFTVGWASGNFAALTGSTGLIRDFSFVGPGSPNFIYPTSASPLLAFQSFNGAPGLTFTLTSVGVVAQSASALQLSGQGIFTWAGFSPTPGTFTFSGSGAGDTFSFSAAQAVPEPTSLALLGAGLLAFATSLRRRRRAS
jgi:hypothetical protein